ncbi:MULTISPECIES: class I adenylate-forming enzyme family protein [unclassified Sporosarcina]|uniref:class I adenylate-forming enzyme family protein n=1 Tax=unclassified Sporosarcina TaxID=2647733 RepID=UPI000C16EA04|nr:MULTISPECIES: AMP-binding protein [unclassified Sporosarcina]PIC97905.1 long-chain fatty acid--CoA ligase [Sporosarcina sp. P29]PID03855.1 long-chain fatty acid--CoA ligase [Sporosarcina sp. P30]PID07867.1 long-chain fatty acid--CoA ligase [Sporosarcina sp. P31]PID10663.1 long-chain fatty acid--CoA ligase [Sporosarcina sp. P32b]
MVTINETLLSAVNTYPDKVFLQDGSKSLTYKQLDEVTDRLASAFLEEGLTRGDHIAILALNQIEWLISYFAAAKIGVGAVALSVRYRAPELEYMINHSEVKAIVSIDKIPDFNFSDFFLDFQSKIPSVEKYIFIGEGFEGSSSYSELLERNPNNEKLNACKKEVDPEDLAIMIYTSGTTGKPKGSMITHRSILASARAQVNHFQVREDDITIQCLPLNHVGGITCQVTVTLISKGTAILIPEFRPEYVLTAIQAHKATIFGGVPTMYLMLLSYNDFFRYDLSSLRISVVGGSNVEPALCNEIMRKIPNTELLGLYGLSESSGACILSRTTDSIEKVQTTLGVLIGDFIAKIVDENQQEVGIGEMGELVVKGDCVAKGYYRDVESTKEAFAEDGWLYTGDLVTIDAEGYISFKGRKKEVYIQGGFNVLPVEIENVLTMHPDISNAAGIGVPHSFYGEIGRYYIVLNVGIELTEAELIAYCREHLADYKIPKQFVFVDELPMTPAGKIQKSKLKEMYLTTSDSRN